MTCYVICGLVMGSELPLPELRAAPGQEPQCVVEWAGGPSPHDYSWFHQEVTPAGQVFFALARTAAGYVLRFPRVVDFVLSPTGTAIRCQPFPNTAPELCRQLLLGHVLPLMLTLRGQLVLHASSIVTVSGAILFIGPTGSGKSTLAASLAAQGQEVLADDWLVVRECDQGWQALPSIPVLRLRADMIGLTCPAAAIPRHPDKVRLTSADSPALRFTAEPCLIRRLYFLDSTGTGAGVRIAPALARVACVELLKNAFQVDGEDAATHEQRFRGIARLAAQPSLRWLRYPRDLDALAAIHQAIINDAVATPTRPSDGALDFHRP